MKSTLALIALFLFSSLTFAIETNDFKVFGGKYKLPDGRYISVIPNHDGLSLQIDSGSLLEFADINADSRVLAIKKKTSDILNAAINGDRTRVAELLQKSPGKMEDYVDSFFDVLEPALNLKPKLNEFRTVSVTYRDEDSEYGFADKSWGWETFTTFSKNNKEVIVRLVWDGILGHNVHRGTGKFPISKDTLEFQARKPSRSWIRVYSPETKQIQMVRELPRESRKNIVPARFIAYDIDTHNTVGIRFRMQETAASMRLEIGPLGSDIFTSANRVSQDIN